MGVVGVEFCRSEEEQRQDFIKGVLQFLLLPGAGKRRVMLLITVWPHPTLISRDKQKRNKHPPPRPSYSVS